MSFFRHTTDVQVHPAGALLLVQGSPGDRMFFLQEGQVEIRLGEAVLERIGPGGFFGEMCLIDSAPRSANAYAVTEVRVHPIDEKRFLRLVQETPGFALAVMRKLAERLRHMNAHA